MKQLPAIKTKNQELEFLPAALEICETPPSPIGRWITGSIMAFFIIAIVWAWFGKLDIVAVAHGKIIPNGHSKIIQPLEIGTVLKINVTEGQEVNKGDILIELDPSITNADLKRLQEELYKLEQDISRLQQLVQRTDPTGQQSIKTTPVNRRDPLQQRILTSQWAEYQSRLAVLQNQQDKLHAEHNTLDTQIKKLEATLPLITRRAEDLKGLATKKVVAEHQYLEVEQARIELVHDLKTQKSRTIELNAAINAIETQRQQTQDEFRRNTLLELADSQRKLQITQQETIKAESRSRAQTLIAPVSGVIQQLTTHTVGGIVTPAQALMVVVPKLDTLEVEAMLENKDIGFVYSGQRAAVKIETFPFTKYGLIDGEIINISNDAIPDEQRGLIYKMRVLMKQSTIQVGERLVNLSPGMAVTVEIKTGKRRMIEYFLAPLLRYRQESIRER